MPDAVPASSWFSPARVWFQVGPLAVTGGRIAWGILLAVSLVLLALFWRQIDIEAVHAWAERVPGWSIIVAIAIAPLVGVPVAMLHVVAGVRFGLGPGLLVVAVTTLFHHAAGYLLVRLAPHVFAQRLANWNQRFPRGAHLPMTIFCCVLPGMPYMVQLYLLPLLGVPLMMLLTVSAPLHVLRAVISVIGGDISDDLTPTRIALLAAYYVGLALVCGLTVRWLRSVLAAEKAPTADVESR